MDKYEYKVRADEIKALIAEGSYEKAAEIADTIDWRRVKSVMMLCTISDLYKINRRYEDSRDILLLAYEKHTGGRLIVFSLCELSIKLEEYVQALQYYQEFVQLAPSDSGRYVLKYKLYEAQDVSLEERIDILEELKKKDYKERWGYELAYLYHRVGLETKCVEECDEMFLWFGEGKYVLKALELKKLHRPLTEIQEAKYELMKKNGGIIESDMQAEGKAIQEEVGIATEEEEDDEFSRATNLLTDPTQEIPRKEAEEEIQVKIVDVGQNNTINLQQELAGYVKEVLEKGVTAPIEMQENEEEALLDDLPEPPQTPAAIEEESDATLVMPAEELRKVTQDTDEMHLIGGTLPEEAPVSEEVFFGNTEEVNIEDVVSELVEKDAKADKAAGSVQPPKAAQAGGKSAPISNTGIIRSFHKPSGFDEMLSQEYDGQISIVVPEETKIEKQITGQLSIDDVMAEWDKIKKENEEKRLREIQERIHRQTNSLFEDFDEATKNGLLEELEKAMIDAVKKGGQNKPKVVKISDIAEEKAKSEEPPVKEPESAEEPPVNETESEETPVIEEMPVKEETALEEMEEKEAEEAASEEEDPAEEEALPEESEEEEEKEPAEAAAKKKKEAPAEEAAKKKKEASAAATQEEKEASGEAKSEENEPEESDAEDQEHKPSNREMTKSEREQFAPFIHHKKTRRQIVDVIDNVTMAAYTGNIIITGEEGTGTTALAKLLVNEVQAGDANFSGKVAKISGTVLNKKDVGNTLSRLEGGALIIERATVLKKATTAALVKELNQEGRGLIVLLEDKKEDMDAFLKDNTVLEPVFNLRVDVEALDDQTLVKYAKKYAAEQEYAIDELGVLALHTRIADLQTSDHEVTLAEIEELVDEAIYYADKKTPKHFFDILVGKRYDEEDMIVLREKDFMHY